MRPIPIPILSLALFALMIGSCARELPNDFRGLEGVWGQKHYGGCQSNLKLHIQRSSAISYYDDKRTADNMVINVKYRFGSPVKGRLVIGFSNGPELAYLTYDANNITLEKMKNSNGAITQRDFSDSYKVFDIVKCINEIVNKP